MKVAHQVLSLCALTTVVKGWYLPLSGGHLSWPSSSNGLVSGSRVSRQSTRANSRECTRVQANADCPVAQNIIDAISRCGSFGNEKAIMIENECRRNSAGEYCKALSFSSIESACQSGCSATCRKILTEGGCCLNFYMDRVTRYFEACIWDIPSACTNKSLSIPTSSDDASCSSPVDFLVYLRDVTCKNLKPAYHSLTSKDNCQDSVRQLEATCRYRDGKNCMTEVYITANTLVNNATANCPWTFNCSTSCRSSLIDLNSNLGCCLNILNASLSVGSDPSYNVITDNALWKQCGITPPGICESSFTAADSVTEVTSSAYVIAGNIAFLVVSSFLLTFV